MKRPFAGLVALAAAISMGTHIGDAIPRVELPTVRKAHGPRHPRRHTGKGKSQGGPGSKAYARWRRTRMRMQRESRRRNRR